MHKAGASKDGGVPRRRSRTRLEDQLARYEELAAELSRIGLIARGSLALRSHRCGKTGCCCTGDPARLHGPYWHLTSKVNGKTMNRRLSEEEAGRYKEWIANDRRLRALVDEMHSVAQEVIALTLGEQNDAPKV